MNSLSRIGLALCLLVSVNSANAQSTDSKQSPPNTTVITKTSSTNADVKERRLRARSLLVSLSTDARTFRNQTLRARSLGRIADALWQVDPEQARLLFRKAWEAAEVADQESDRKLQEEINQQKSRTGGGFAINLPPNVRREVLKLAARNDRVIAEEFLEKLTTQKVESATSRPNPLSDRPDEALSQRLGVATELLKAGDTERALQFAASAAVAPELLATFFQSAATILLRPLPAPGQPDQSSSGVNGTYLVIKRLLPFFEQSAPAEMVESLRGHLNALNSVISDNTRRRDDESISRGIKPEKPAAEREQALLDRIDRAKTSAERDSLYIQLAFMASNKGEVRARDFVNKVEDPELRKQAQAFIDASLANVFVEKKAPDQALELVQKGDLTHIHKAWVLTECAKIVAKTDRDNALELIDQATDEARRLEPSDPALPRALIAVANALKVVDVARVWDATFDAVKAANSAEGFTGEDGELIIRFQSKGHASISNKYVADFDLDGIFKDLAVQDYDQAVELARGFQAEGPRAVATIAIARAILQPKKGASQ
jgi:hypothetical protein